MTLSSIEDDSDKNAMKGFAIVNVHDMQEAIKVVKSDPFLQTGRKIRLSQMMEIPTK